MSNRRLAAIMFTDIVGYTAMMQQNEAKGMAKAKAFREEMQAKVEAHHGELLEIRGDGSLSLFNSAVDAVTCAKEIQKTLREKVPLRIGIHLGDIVQKEGHIFGDAMNIASRIESMGVAGAVLLSSSIRQQIKNKPEFELTSLGRFSFKNIEEDMSVYALANKDFPIPKPEEMQGKGTLAKQNSSLPIPSPNPQRQWIRFGSVGFIAMAIVGAVLFWIFSAKQTGKENILPKEIRQGRIAVLPFDNRTNDPELDILGDIAADWINRGLMELGDVEVVSPATARMHQDAIGIRPNDPQGRATFASLTGAQNLVQGSFYESGGELVFNLELHDAEDGKLRESFDAVRGNKQDKETLIGNLSETVMGYWAAKDLVDNNRIKTPKYEAYDLYLKSLSLWPFPEQKLLEIIDIDSTFYLSKIHFLTANRGGIGGENIPHFKFLDRHIESLSMYEKGWYDFLKNYYQGDPKRAFYHLNELRLTYPKDPILNHETAAIALECLHNPELALSIYSEIPLKTLKPEKMGAYFFFRLKTMITSYLYLGKIEESKKLIPYFKQNYPNAPKIFSIYGQALTALAIHDTALFESSYAMLLQNANQESFIYILFSYNLLRSSLFSSKKHNQISRDLLNTADQLGKEHPVYTFHANIWASLKKDPREIEMDLSYSPKTGQIINLRYGISTFLEADEEILAQKMFKELETFLNPSMNVPAQWGEGYAHYMIGVIYTKRGEQKLAIEHLAKAKKLGVSKDINCFEYDRELSDLYDHPEFQEIIKPVWPEGYERAE